MIKKEYLQKNPAESNGQFLRFLRCCHTVSKTNMNCHIKRYTSCECGSFYHKISNYDISLALRKHYVSLL